MLVKFLFSAAKVTRFFVLSVVCMGLVSCSNSSMEVVDDDIVAVWQPKHVCICVMRSCARESMVVVDDDIVVVGV